MSAARRAISIPYHALRRWATGESALAAITRRGASPFLQLPDFLILGAQKSGTSALFNYLMMHPQIQHPWRKEVRFFSHDEYYHRGLSYYRAHMPLRVPGRMTYDATPEYLYFPWVAGRIRDNLPNAKMIVVLRNPVERAYSHWNMMEQLMSPEVNEPFPHAFPAVRRGLEAIREEQGIATFEKSIEFELNHFESIEEWPEPSFLRRGLYCEQLERYFQLFDRGQLKIIESGELKADAVRICKNVLEFLELKPCDPFKTKLEPVHQRVYKSSMAPETRHFLQDFYRTPNQRLFELLGREFDWS